MLPTGVQLSLQARAQAWAQLLGPSTGASASLVSQHLPSPFKLPLTFISPGCFNPWSPSHTPCLWTPLPLLYCFFLQLARTAPSLVAVGWERRGFSSLLMPAPVCNYLGTRWHEITFNKAKHPPVNLRHSKTRQGLPGSAQSDIRLPFVAVVKLPTSVSIAIALQHVLRTQSLSRELGECSPSQNWSLRYVRGAGARRWEANLVFAAVCLSLKAASAFPLGKGVLFHSASTPLLALRHAAAFQGFGQCGERWLIFNAIYSYYSYLTNRSKKLRSAKNQRARHIMPAGQRTLKPCKP